jgi:hypothetical protein
LLVAFLTACSTGDSVDIGPDRPADLVVCLDPNLAREEARTFREERFRGGEFGDVPIEDYAAQGGDSFTLNWASNASAEQRAQLAETLRRQPEVVSVTQNSTVIDVCRS